MKTPQRLEPTSIPGERMWGTEGSLGSAAEFFLNRGHGERRGPWDPLRIFFLNRGHGERRGP